ncbi:MAG: amidohydrolase family protein, partial [Acidimicrobiia bacterium]|nr:amidohydrolase family protein [Acidimicrobiia bacterium]
MPTIIHGDRVYARLDADAILVNGGRVVAVGHHTDLADPGHREERFPGATIVPGLVDAHFHPTAYTGALQRLSLKATADFSDLLDQLRATSSLLPPGETLIGVRLDDETMAERALPTRALLDQAATARPILLYRYCGHIAVTNTAALELAGVTSGTPDPPGGSFDRDDTGAPTGVLRETAIGVVSAAVGDRAAGLTPAQTVEASRLLAATGLTALGAIVSPGESLLCDGSNELQLVIDAAPDLALPLSVLVATESPDELTTAAEMLERAGRRVRFHGLKLFSDGSLGGHTAALFEPYADEPSTWGTHRLPMEVALPVALRALDLGGAVA